MTPAVNELYTRIRAAQHCVALTGAGVSTLSGIPDFRGKDGLYSRTDVDAHKLFDVDYFQQDPSYYYTHARQFIYDLDTKQPSLVHKALANLEQEGALKTLITQNIDLLHQKAGSKHVLEVHGSPQTHHCLRCGQPYTFTTIVHMLKTVTVPLCTECGGVVKPDIVFFGEALPTDVLAEAEYEAKHADLMLVLGSSLTVYPAANIPLYTVRHGGKLIIVNADPTPLDELASHLFRNLAHVFAIEELCPPNPHWQGNNF